MRLSGRILLTVAAAVAAFFVSAVGIAIADLYISGHGGIGLTSRHLVDSSSGLHLSVGDGVALLLSAAAAIAVNVFWPRRQ